MYAMPFTRPGYCCAQLKPTAEPQSCMTRVLAGEVAIRVRDLIRKIAMEHELTILSGKVARDHVHVFVSYRPNQDISTIVQWLKGISSRVLL